MTIFRPFLLSFFLSFSAPVLSTDQVKPYAFYCGETQTLHIVVWPPESNKKSVEARACLYFYRQTIILGNATKTELLDLPERPLLLKFNIPYEYDLSCSYYYRWNVELLSSGASASTCNDESQFEKCQIEVGKNGLCLDGSSSYRSTPLSCAQQPPKKLSSILKQQCNSSQLKEGASVFELDTTNRRVIMTAAGSVTVAILLACLIAFALVARSRRHRRSQSRCLPSSRVPLLIEGALIDGSLLQRFCQQHCERNMGPGCSAPCLMPPERGSGNSNHWSLVCTCRANADSVPVTCPGKN